MVIEMYQRNDLLLEVTVTDENGDALDLSGASLDFVVDPIGIHLTVGSGITILDPPTAGKIEIEISHDDSDAPAGVHQYELLITDIEGHRYTASRGLFKLHRSLVEG